MKEKEPRETCENLLRMNRKSCLSKSIMNEILKEFSRVLPFPNNLPNSFDKLLDNVDHIYQKALKKHREQGDCPFISLQLHLDGLPLVKSSKLGLWALSSTVIELPSHIRYRRRNTLLLSVVVGYGKPDINKWLNPIVRELTAIQENGLVIKQRIGDEITVQCFSSIFKSRLRPPLAS
ncbi:unnamed protein product [Didymodactylos carnosus]|uniref:Uncharacterized protein n=1 Tax=Didymodactylos carnosus TaxID=1234261 RepID=A0A814N0L6_9BILA|nr:unnamed protein product [Didymodactylos carnosus]CAF3851825.1 unnamed protein product [Didymodactylos carnosus]